MMPPGKTLRQAMTVQRRRQMLRILRLISIKSTELTFGAAADGDRSGLPIFFDISKTNFSHLVVEVCRDERREEMNEMEKEGERREEREEKREKRRERRELIFRFSLFSLSCCVHFLLVASTPSGREKLIISQMFNAKLNLVENEFNI